MMNPQMLELQHHYLDLCEQAKQEPHPAMLDLIAKPGAPDQANRVRVLEHLGQAVNQERDTLHQAGLLVILDALREAGYEDRRILRSPEELASFAFRGAEL